MKDASFAWILLLMARLIEVTPLLLSCEHDNLYNAKTMEVVSRSYDVEKYDLDKVGFLVQSGFKYGSYVSKMQVFSFSKTYIHLSIH